jgi:hypothetical protein
MPRMRKSPRWWMSAYSLIATPSCSPRSAKAVGRERGDDLPQPVVRRHPGQLHDQVLVRLGHGHRRPDRPATLAYRDPRCDRAAQQHADRAPEHGIVEQQPRRAWPERPTCESTDSGSPGRVWLQCATNGMIGNPCGSAKSTPTSFSPALGGIPRPAARRRPGAR